MIIRDIPKYFQQGKFCLTDKDYSQIINDTNGVQLSSDD